MRLAFSHSLRIYTPAGFKTFKRSTHKEWSLCIGRSQDAILLSALFDRGDPLQKLDTARAVQDFLINRNLRGFVVRHPISATRAIISATRQGCPALPLSAAGSRHPARCRLVRSRLRAEVPLEVAVWIDTHAVFFITFHVTAKTASRCVGYASSIADQSFLITEVAPVARLMKPP